MKKITTILLALFSCSAPLFADVIQNIRFLGDGTGTSQYNPLGKAIDIVLDALVSAPVAGICLGIFIIRCVIAYRDSDSEKGRKVVIAFAVTCIVVFLTIPFVTKMIAVAAVVQQK